MCMCVFERERERRRKTEMGHEGVIVNPVAVKAFASQVRECVRVSQMKRENERERERQ